MKKKEIMISSVVMDLLQKKTMKKPIFLFFLLTFLFLCLFCVCVWVLVWVFVANENCMVLIVFAYTD